MNTDSNSLPSLDPAPQTLATAPGGRPIADQRGSTSSTAVSIRGLMKQYRHPWTGKISRGLEALDLEVMRGEEIGRAHV